MHRLLLTFILGLPFIGFGQAFDLAELQRPPEKPVGNPGLAPVIEKETSKAEWMVRKKILRQEWLKFLGAIDRPAKPPAFEVIEEDEIDGITRQRIRYVSGNWPTEAYLLLPAKGKTPRPGVVVFHSTVGHSIRQPAGVEGRREMYFGLNAARRGWVALCPRNVLWPDNHHIDTRKQTPLMQQAYPGAKGMAKMLLDAQIAVDLLAALPEVDANAIGAVGHSLGAKEVLYLAAFDERIKVAVSSEGGIGTRFSNWEAPWYLGPAIRTPDVRREHHELLALMAPRPFLLIGGESADGDRSWPWIERALPVYRLYGDPPRLGFLNHRKGHAVPPEAEQLIYDWLGAYLVR